MAARRLPVTTGPFPISLAEFQAANGLHFRDETLLRTALTHPSYANEHPGSPVPSNQRLEYLGDAVLSFVTATYLYDRFPDYAEGDLTKLRVALVRGDALAEVARRCRIGEAMWMGKGEEKNGGRQRRSALEDGFEAVVGALYLDQGVEAVRAFVAPHLQALTDDMVAAALTDDAVSRLQSLVQERLGITPRYETIQETGPAHAPQFTVAALIADHPVGTGMAANLQSAKMAAAAQALTLLTAEDADAAARWEALRQPRA
jgi:ribonuclease-3